MSMTISPISAQAPAITAKPASEEASESSAERAKEAAKAAPAPGTGTLVDVSA